MTQDFYAAKNKNDEIRAISSSGGIFLQIAKNIIDKNGIVYGAIYDAEHQVIHHKATKYEDVLKMSGSKYARSNTSGIYKQVEEDLEKNKIVLFSGTPCQVFALKKYLKKEYTNLYTIDLVCHGAPNPKYLSDYIKYQEKKNHSKLVEINMRYKDIKNYQKNKLKKHLATGKIEPHIMMLKFENGKIYKSKSDYDKFYQLFDYFIDVGCFKCPFSKTKRVADITIGDFHEFSSKLGEFNDGNGVSLVIVNSLNGQEIVKNISSNIEFKQKKAEMCLQPAIQFPAKQSKDYFEFMKDYNKYGFEYVLKKYSKHGIKYKTKYLLEKVRILDKLLYIKKVILK